MQTIQSNAIKYLAYLILNNWKFDKNQIQTFSTLKKPFNPKKTPHFTFYGPPT